MRMYAQSLLTSSIEMVSNSRGIEMFSNNIKRFYQLHNLLEGTRQQRHLRGLQEGVKMLRQMQQARQPHLTSKKVETRQQMQQKCLKLNLYVKLDRKIVYQNTINLQCNSFKMKIKMRSRSIKITRTLCQVQSKCNISKNSSINNKLKSLNKMKKSPTSL